MNMEKTKTVKMQPVGAADLAHIRALASRDCSDLPLRCAAYRRRVRVRRYATATVLFVGICLGYRAALPVPRFDELSTTSVASASQLCDIVENIIYVA